MQSDNDVEAVMIKRPGLAGRREWVAAIIPPEPPRKSRNRGLHPDLARPAILWWRSTLSRSGDASSWPDKSADNDNVDPKERGPERPWAVRDINPRPKHTAEALIASARRGARFSVTTTRAADGTWGSPRRRRLLVRTVRNGQTARVGGLEFTTERARGLQVVRAGSDVVVRRPRIAIGTMVRVDGYPVKDEVGRSRDSRAANAVAAEKASSDHYVANLGGAALPHLPSPHRLFMGMAVASSAANDNATRSLAEHVDTVEGAMIAHQEMERFRKSNPAESKVLDRAMTARNFAELADTASSATGRRLLKKAIDALELFLAA